MNARASDWKVAAAVAVVVLAGSACFHHTRDWNSASRLLLTYSLAQYGRIDVNPFVVWRGRLFAEPLTRDMASRDGRNFYCDKAPGQSWLGVPPAWLMTRSGWIQPHPAMKDEAPLRAIDLSRWNGDYWLTLATSGALTAATSGLLCLLLQRFGASRVASAAIGLLYGVGSPALAYGSLYYGHAAAGLFLLAATTVVAGDRARWSASWLAAGLAMGAAVATEYTLAVAAAILGMFSLFVGGGIGPAIRRCTMYVAGGLPFAILLGWYHFEITGNALVPAYKYEVSQQFAAVHHTATGIPLTLPKWEAVAGLLWGRWRGLLWFAPACVFAVLGIVVLFRRGDRRVAALATLCCVGHLLVVAAFPNWDGGLAMGPRFLVPILPLLMFAAGIALSSTWKPVAALGWTAALGGAVLSIAMTACGARMFPGESPLELWNRTSADPAREIHVGDRVATALGMAHPSSGASLAALIAALTIASGAVLLLAWRLDRRLNLR